MKKMITPALLTGWGFLPYGPLTGTVPSLPEFYWNAVSEEQRWKQLCLNLAALQKWTQDFTTVMNANLKELDSRFPVTDAELARDVPVTRAGTLEIESLPANSAAVYEVPYPESLATGVADAVILTPEDEDQHNLTAVLQRRTETGFTFLLVNNSVSAAEDIRVDYLAAWNTRPQPEKTNPTPQQEDQE